MNSTNYTDPLLEAVKHYTETMDLGVSCFYASSSNRALNRRWGFYRKSDHSQLFEFGLNDEEMFIHLSPALKRDQTTVIREFLDDYKAKHPVGRSGILSCCGINPEAGGAIAILDLHFNIIALKDCTGNVEDDEEIFEHFNMDFRPALTCMRQMTAMDRKGPRINFQQGTSSGIWQGILLAHSAPYRPVKRGEWLDWLDEGRSMEQRKMRTAMRKFSDPKLELESYPGRTDALLLASRAVCSYRECQ